VRHVADIGGMRNAYNILVGKPEGERSLRRSRCKWEDNIKMVLIQIECEDVYCNRVAVNKDHCLASANTIP